MATAYAAQDIPTFNALADQWNAWVRQYFGEDANLLMQKMIAPVDLSKPYILANNTTGGGIVHKIDGMNQSLATRWRGIPGRNLVKTDVHQKSKYGSACGVDGKGMKRRDHASHG